MPYGFIVQHFHITAIHHCFTRASRSDTSTALGPASGVNDRILNYEVCKSQLHSKDFLTSTLIFYLPCFHIPQICSKTRSPVCCQKILARSHTFLFNSFFFLKEGTVPL